MSEGFDLLRISLAAGVLLLLARVWSRISVASLRHNLFVQRDRLFLDAARGDVSFEHPGYRFVRENFNSAIRFAERITLVQLVIFGFWFRRQGIDVSAAVALDKATAFTGLSEEQVTHLNGYLQRLNEQIALLVASRSVLIMGSVAVVIAWLAAKQIMVRVLRVGTSWVGVGARRGAVAAATAVVAASPVVAGLGATVHVAETGHAQHAPSSPVCA
jgi:hypothetical protein